MANDTVSLSHTKWNCKYHIVFAPKYRIQENIWADQGGYRKNHKTAMRNEEGGNNRDRSVSGSYSHVSEHTAEHQRIAICGIPEREKITDDIRQTCKFEVQI